MQTFHQEGNFIKSIFTELYCFWRKPDLASVPIIWLFPKEVSYWLPSGLCGGCSGGTTVLLMAETYSSLVEGLGTRTLRVHTYARVVPCTQLCNPRRVPTSKIIER